MDKQQSVFVKLDDYKDIVDIITLTKQKLEDVKSVLARIEQLEAKERSIIDSWKNMVADVESRLEGVQGRLVKK